jgi:hypothetical protein
MREIIALEFMTLEDVIQAGGGPFDDSGSLMTYPQKSVHCYNRVI